MEPSAISMSAPISTQRVQTTGARAATYTYNALGLGTEKDSSGTLIAYTRDNKGNLISERTSSGNYTYLYDGLGSVVALLAPTYAGVTNTYIYDPYGVTEHQTGSQYNPWQFAGGYFDASTLYYKYGTRYYDRFGRWTQQDPVPSVNPYLYAGDDPVNNVDPSGQLLIKIFYSVVGNILGFAIYGITGFQVQLTPLEVASVVTGATAAVSTLVSTLPVSSLVQNLLTGYISQAFSGLNACTNGAQATILFNPFVSLGSCL